MNQRATTIIAAAATVVSLVGISACSDSGDLQKALTQKAEQQTLSTIGDSGSSGDGSSDNSFPAVPPGGIPGVSNDCLSYLQAIGTAFSGGNEQSFGQLGDAFKKLEDAVPADLRDDVEVLSDAFSKLGDVYKKYNYDYTKIITDPAAQAILSDPKFSEASDALNNWLDTSCQTAG